MQRGVQKCALSMTYAWGDSTTLPPLPRSAVANSTEDPTSRWVLMRTMSDDQSMVVYWRAWTWITGISSASSLFVILLILCTPRLRSYVNHFIVGLAIPDFTFSTACTISCSLNEANVEYWGGAGACKFQSIYVIFGFAGSMWMNVVITVELARLAAMSDGGQRYVPPTLRQASTAHRLPSSLVTSCHLPSPRMSSREVQWPCLSFAEARCRPLRQVWARCAAVYLYALGLALMPFLSGAGPPLKFGSHRGLACLPMAYDPST